MALQVVGAGLGRTGTASLKVALEELLGAPCYHMTEVFNADVRETIPAERLVEWHPGAGWGPLCAALELPEPEAPYPHVNTTDEFRLMAGLDGED